ncbi:MAG: hypothetical protein K0S86_4228 [Geminicoccaceae bacterium]|jgi:hypothetical protein|nr:hypothetical protein [Geminicoccaceae bacterium]
MTDGRASATRVRTRRVRELLVASLLVTTAVVPFLTSPRLPRELEARRCGRVIDLPGPFHVMVNCDSPALLILARDPRLLFSPEYRTRQTRPLYPVIGWVLAMPFRALGFAELGRRLPGGSDTTRGSVSYGSYLPEYIAFQLFNWVLLVVAAVLLRHLVAAPSYFAPRVLLPLAVLLVNEVTKVFFWTPHLQILNVFIAVASLSLLVWMQGRGSDLGWREALGIGLVLGLGGLAYGAFAVPAGAAALCLLAGAGWSGLRQHFSSTLSRVAALLAGFALPIGAWSAVLVARTGSVYSHEVATYRQFVWIRDSSERGADVFGSELMRNFVAYATSLQTVTAFCIFALVGVRVVAYAFRIAREPGAQEAITARAIICYMVANTSFYALLGRPPTRLVWTIVPPILVLLGYEIGQLETALRGRARVALTATVAVLTAGYVVYWFVKPGPWG